jgi:type IV secretion system protein VirB10
MSAPHSSERDEISQDSGLGIRPLVGRKVGSASVWAFAVVLAASAGALFVSLERHRAQVATPQAAAGDGEGAAMIAPAPAFMIPPDYPSPTPLVSVPESPRTTPAPVAQPARVIVQQARASAPVVIEPPALPAAPRSEVVFDASRAPPRAIEEAGDGGKGERVRASRFANPATTVPKGTVIQAVLESALDSTRAGLARAIISRDVVSFDGSHVLIGRGSRLIGEYKADLTSGQSRALIQWQRLMRPDGAIINLDSPSADPLGRAGVKGKVDGHFIERYGGAILQSALDVGTQVAANKLTSGTGIYALPSLYALSGAGQAGTRVGQQNVQPTIKVKQGTSVSVFVARDLDFTNVEP